MALDTGAGIGSAVAKDQDGGNAVGNGCPAWKESQACILPPSAPEDGAGRALEKIARAYSSPPWWYDIRGFFILTFSYNSTLWSQVRFFGPNFGPKHLEVAVGTGTLLKLLLLWRRWKRLPNVRIYGIDYAPSMLDGARRLFRRNPSVELHLADAAALPYPNEMFDTANVANAIHCFPDADAALKEIRRVLKLGGTLAVNALLYPRGSEPFSTAG